MEAAISLADLVTDELTTGFAMWGDKRGLPLMNWVFNMPRDGHRELFIVTPTTFYDDNDGCAHAELWADALGFSQQEDTWPGFVGYEGTIAGLDVTILGMNDRETYIFWQQVTGPDEPQLERRHEPVRKADYQPWPDINLDGKDPIRTITNLIDVAITRGFRTWGKQRNLPLCSWRTITPYPGTGEMLRTVIVSDESDDETIDQAQRWADALGLQQRDYTLGCIQHSGDFGGVPILVSRPDQQVRRRERGQQPLAAAHYNPALAPAPADRPGPY